MDRATDKFIDQNFINVKLTLNTLWMYQIRKNNYAAISSNINLLKGRVLDVGCGIMPYKKVILNNKNVNEYIGLDLEKADYYKDIKPDLLWNGKNIPLEENSIDCVIITEVLEHCFDPVSLLKEVRRVLKHEGLIIATIPFIWHLHEVPYDEYRYTPFSLEKIFIESGFNRNSIKATGGWDSALSQMLGLWVTFRPIKKFYKSLLLRIIYFIIKILDKTDRKPVNFLGHENSMPSGLIVIAFK